MAGAAGLLLAAGLLAVVAAPASAARSISFDDTPSGWSVHEGERDRNVGKVSASGLKNPKNIRYSITGAAGFSITPRGGRVAYSGAELGADTVSVTITARHVKNKAQPATITVSVAVHRHDHDTGGDAQLQSEPEVQADPDANQGGQGQSNRPAQPTSEACPAKMHYYIDNGNPADPKYNGWTYDSAAGKWVPHCHYVAMRGYNPFMKDGGETDGHYQRHYHACYNPAGPVVHKGHHITTPHDGEKYQAWHTHKIKNSNHYENGDRVVLRDHPTKPGVKIGKIVKGDKSPTDGHDGLCDENGGMSQRRANMIDQGKKNIDACLEGNYGVGGPCPGDQGQYMANVWARAYNQCVKDGTCVWSNWCVEHYHTDLNDNRKKNHSSCSGHTDTQRVGHTHSGAGYGTKGWGPTNELVGFG
ncbi:MAG: hypothetical protein OXH42_01950 [Acidimicrobiaceae bacterium]|nr:hypothetical protein [Acidimicrobiaceae bacterium]